MKNLVKRNALIYSERSENSNKFYIVELTEENGIYEVTVKYGRLGKRPTTSTKSFQSEYRANDFYSSKLSDKRKKGYEDVALEDIMFNEGEFFN